MRARAFTPSSLPENSSVALKLFAAVDDTMEHDGVGELSFHEQSDVEEEYDNGSASDEDGELEDEQGKDVTAFHATVIDRHVTIDSNTYDGPSQFRLDSTGEEELAFARSLDTALPASSAAARGARPISSQPATNSLRARLLHSGGFLSHSARNLIRTTRNAASVRARNVIEDSRNALSLVSSGCDDGRGYSIARSLIGMGNTHSAAERSRGGGRATSGSSSSSSSSLGGSGGGGSSSTNIERRQKPRDGGRHVRAWNTMGKAAAAVSIEQIESLLAPTSGPRPQSAAELVLHIAFHPSAAAKVTAGKLLCRLPVTLLQGAPHGRNATWVVGLLLACLSTSAFPAPRMRRKALLESSRRLRTAAPATAASTARSFPGSASYAGHASHLSSSAHRTAGVRDSTDGHFEGSDVAAAGSSSSSSSAHRDGHDRYREGDGAVATFVVAAHVVACFGPTLFGANAAIADENERATAAAVHSGATTAVSAAISVPKKSKRHDLERKRSTDDGDIEMNATIDEGASPTSDVTGERSRSVGGSPVQSYLNRMPPTLPTLSMPPTPILSHASPHIDAIPPVTVSEKDRQDADPRHFYVSTRFPEKLLEHLLTIALHEAGHPDADLVRAAAVAAAASFGGPLAAVSARRYRRARHQRRLRLQRATLCAPAVGSLVFREDAHSGGNGAAISGIGAAVRKRLPSQSSPLGLPATIQTAEAPTSAPEKYAYKYKKKDKEDEEDEEEEEVEEEEEEDDSEDLDMDGNGIQEVDEGYEDLPVVSLNSFRQLLNPHGSEKSPLALRTAAALALRRIARGGDGGLVYDIISSDDRGCGKSGGGRSDSGGGESIYHHSKAGGVEVPLTVEAMKPTTSTFGASSIAVVKDFGFHTSTMYVASGIAPRIAVLACDALACSSDQTPMELSGYLLQVVASIGSSLCEQRHQRLRRDKRSVEQRELQRKDKMDHIESTSDEVPPRKQTELKENQAEDEFNSRAVTTSFHSTTQKAKLQLVAKESYMRALLEYAKAGLSSEETSLSVKVPSKETKHAGDEEEENEEGNEEDEAENTRSKDWQSKNEAEGKSKGGALEGLAVPLHVTVPSAHRRDAATALGAMLSAAPALQRHRRGANEKARGSDGRRATTTMMRHKNQASSIGKGEGELQKEGLMWQEALRILQLISERDANASVRLAAKRALTWIPPQDQFKPDNVL